MCKDVMPLLLEMCARLSPQATFAHLVNGYQGKYEIPQLEGKQLTRGLLKDCKRRGSEQLLRRMFEIDGKAVYNPFGGDFLRKIQGMPLVLEFWVVLRNIIEVIIQKPHEEVTINSILLFMFLMIIQL